jgi:hypothetical protein
MSKFLRRIYKALLAPIRHAVRMELSRQEKRKVDTDLNAGPDNIGKLRQQLAGLATAHFVNEYMAEIPSVNSPEEVIKTAFAEATVTEDDLILEFGVFQAGSINLIASLTEKTIYGFDSFDGLPEYWRDGYEVGTFALTELPDTETNVELIKGWFDESLPSFLQKHTGTVSFLHVDCDLYSSTKTVFTLLQDRIQPGCIIVFDEYFNYPGWEQGEILAFQEFLQATGLNFKYLTYNRRHEQVAVRITDK